MDLGYRQDHNGHTLKKSNIILQLYQNLKFNRMETEWNIGILEYMCLHIFTKASYIKIKIKKSHKNGNVLGPNEYNITVLFRYPFHPRVTAVARKRSQSFFQKYTKYAYTLRMWLCMKWHGAWLYGVHRTCAKTAAVSCGTSHATAVSTPLWWIFKNVL